MPTKEVPDDETPFYYMFDSHRDDNMQTLPWNPYAGRATSDDDDADALALMALSRS